MPTLLHFCHKLKNFRMDKWTDNSKSKCPPHKSGSIKRGKYDVKLSDNDSIAEERKYFKYEQAQIKMVPFYCINFMKTRTKVFLIDIVIYVSR